MRQRSLYGWKELSLDPSEIDLEYVPEFDEHVEFVAVGDEAVIYENHTGVIHQLDSIATAVAKLFDGRLAIGAIVDVLDEGFDEQRATIETDVLRLVRELGGKELLDGIERSSRNASDVR